ncbi:MAG: methylated-DNA--[protein]-cysteine S-methyltransferase [Gammaproteobacteria bacterium]|nr:methylated-DNA--[protein]-cysteine S-methyltransferase [Gammaproteobacteria bacterium]
MRAKLKSSHFDAVIDSPIPIQRNRLGLRLHNNRLRELVFLTPFHQLQAPQDVFGENVVLQLNQYFADATHQFSINLDLQGTDFQKRVWHALIACPCGMTSSYGDVADIISSAPRAVGGACRHNPIPIIVPCHRVVAKQGLGGYAGQTTGVNMVLKKWLLSHESAI